MNSPRLVVRAFALMLALAAFVPQAAMAQTAHPTYVSGATCDPRSDFLYGSVCGTLTVTPWNPAPGGTVTVTVQGGCLAEPRRLSVSNALPTVIVDGSPVTGTTGAAGAYYGWDPQPVPNNSIGVPIPNDVATHTAVFTIDPATPPTCVVVSGSLASGPWVEFQGNGSGYWYLAKPLKIEVPAVPVMPATGTGLLAAALIGIGLLGLALRR